MAVDYLQKLVVAIELQSLDEMKVCFENGINPNDHFKDRPLIYELITEYPRGPLFRQSVKLFVDYGLILEDKILLAVLMDDGSTLDKLLHDDPKAVTKKYTFDCAFTPLFEVSLLHICAEYNHLNCAKTLVTLGADVNTKAGTDENGLGGQSPIFHTVNQNANNGLDVMKFLIAQSADLSLTVKGIIWGKGYPWETFIPAVNPISYAMMGLLPQFQRSEKHIYEVVGLLFEAAYNIDYMPSNIPNRYLQS